MVKKVRLDQLLVERGLAESRERAQRLVLAGVVLIGEQVVDKPGRAVDAAAPIRIKIDPCPYVSRGGLKLEGALRAFGLIELAGKVALDVGASTGGFSDCLLAHGVERIYAVDTGRGQLHEKLRQDPRVISREQANARELSLEWVGGRKVDLIVIDVSFISLRLILPPLEGVLAEGGWVLALVKPQFEAGRGQVGKGGVVREDGVRLEVLRSLAAFAGEHDWRVRGAHRAEPPGPAGNREYFLWLDRHREKPDFQAVDTLILDCLRGA